MPVIIAFYHLPAVSYHNDSNQGGFHLTYGKGKYTYELADWHVQYPDGWSPIEVNGLAVDSQDRLYAFNTGEYPLTVFDTNTGKLLSHWGEGFFTHNHGARIFNAAARLDLSAAELGSQVDSVMFCLSKGLCAPVGSILAGPRSFIDRARRKRKVMGGGMRQAGILAAAGLIALKDMTRRLREDHENARYLASGLAALPGFSVDASSVEINMVFFRLPDWVDPEKLSEKLKAEGIRISLPEGGLCRFVTHYWIRKEHIDTLLSLLEGFSKERDGRR